MHLPDSVSPSLGTKIAGMWELSARKLRSMERSYDESRGSPVFTVDGAWTSRGWTEWTQGFQYGSALLQFDATGDGEFLASGRGKTHARMAPHLTHMGVHDHGFNNVSTYGALLRMMNEGRIPEDPGERAECELALKVSGAVQARRWTRTADGGGFIYSFNGPHSLFVDTVRSLRALGAAHALGHVLLDEHDQRVSLLARLVQHASSTARWSVYYGEGRDAYDVAGRVAHESVFNVNDGAYRCPSSQQGWSPFTTWTRGLAWAILGFAEEMEYIDRLPAEELAPLGSAPAVIAMMRRAAQVTCEFWLAHTASDGIPYWDTGAPGLERLGDWRARPADPFNEHEPVDSSAAAIACQGLLRLGTWLQARGGADRAAGERYRTAGLSVLARLLEEPYLGTRDDHQGLLLHSVYHRPNGWDHVPPGRKVPCGESSMWGDYHLREAALHAQRILEGGTPLMFWTGLPSTGMPAAGTPGATPSTGRKQP
ncbi:MAG TPA: glycosyl hydrolase [Spirochaetia bacterium]|nr:glycosyl hydrolase [Spirochaetia bacterium]